MTARAIVTLARWLGPWADPARAPDVQVADEFVDELRVRIYGAASARSPFLVAPGLHYAGPDDPRMDRFCRVLAAAGARVVAPFVPDYLALYPCARAIADFARVADALPRWSAHKPIVFSISFGSLLALALAAERPDAIARLVVFGGYRDLRTTLRYCLTGAGRDPLNQPVVLMNLLDRIPHDRAHAGELVAGWRRYVERTWGRPEMKAPARYLAIAEELAPTVPTAVRELFLVGIGARPGAAALVEAALAEESDHTRELDPSPYLPAVRGRVDLVHGAGDDVIPIDQSHALAAALSHADARVHITGLYGHTGASASRLVALPRELATMVRVLRVLAPR
jgi:pimeloyl-ACP methyl ester carboxylesterase